jgi:pimeloyl-ACP methyl ester carboxylesterase
MGLKVRCAKCSRSYDVKETFAGKEFSCRGCGAAVAVPKPEPQEDLDDLEPDEDLVELDEILEKPAAKSKTRPASASRKSAPPPRKSTASRGSKKKDSAGGPSVVILAGGGILLLVMIIAMIASTYVKKDVQSGVGGLSGNGNTAPPATLPNSTPFVAPTMTPGVNSQAAFVAVPVPPLTLPKPVAPDAKPGNVDLATWDPAELRSAASDFAQKRNYLIATSLQDAAVAKDQEGQYNLACYYSMLGKTDAALYWLQLAGQEEGADSDWSMQDSDLASVRRDPRWPAVLEYLRQCNRYWQTSGFSETSLVMPANSARDRPLPVLIGLHGMGSNAHQFVDAESYQQFADTNQIAVLGVSGTKPSGKRSFVWAENPVLDLARVDAALSEVADRLTVQPGQAILFGFSQGALASAEIAARAPDRFAGAIIMSPGGKGGYQMASVQPAPGHRRQGFIVVCGAGEHPGNVALTNQYSSGLRNLQSRVFSKLYPGQNQHSFPANFRERLPDWCRFILSPATAAPTM